MAADERPDDWWWLTVDTPDDGIHLYELGYAARVQHADPVTGQFGPVVDEALSHARLDEILAALGGPGAAELTADGPWQFSMAPGRPNANLEPKAYTEGPKGEQVLTPIKAKPGVTLHLHGAS